MLLRKMDITIVFNGSLGSLLWCEYSLTSWGMLLKLSQMS